MDYAKTLPRLDKKHLIFGFDAPQTRCLSVVPIQQPLFTHTGTKHTLIREHLPCLLWHAVLEVTTYPWTVTHNDFLLYYYNVITAFG